MNIIFLFSLFEITIYVYTIDFLTISINSERYNNRIMKFFAIDVLNIQKFDLTYKERSLFKFFMDEYGVDKIHLFFIKLYERKRY